MMKFDINEPAPSKNDIQVLRQSFKRRIRLYKVSSNVGFLFCLMALLYPLFVGIESMATGFSAQQSLFIGLVLLGCVFGSMELASEEVKKARDARIYDDADTRSCLEIKEWLTLPEIQSYRDQVIAQSRKFINAEVKMMRECYQNHQQAIKDDEAQKACREVYGIAEEVS